MIGSPLTNTVQATNQTSLVAQLLKPGGHLFWKKLLLSSIKTFNVSRVGRDLKPSKLCLVCQHFTFKTQTQAWVPISNSLPPKTIP